MNISSGGLSFDFTATNDNLIKIVQQSKREIQTLADASKTGGKAMDAAFKEASDRLDAHADQISSALSTQRQAVMALEKEMERLKAQSGQQYEAGDLAASEATMRAYQAKEYELQKRRECIQACYNGLDVLEEERQRLERMRQSAKNAGNAQSSLRGQLRQVREQLAEMEATQGVGVRQTEEFRALQAEAGRLADALSDAQAQVNVFSDDNAVITGTITGLSGVAGAFSAAQGAMSLFGVENEKVQEAMLKVQSLMAITTGLQQVANALNKDSAFQLVIVRKAKDLLATSEIRLATALGVSTAAARVFMATITLGLSAAIVAIIAIVEKFRSASAQAAEFNKKVAETATEPVAKVELLASKWRQLGDDLDAKRKFIEDNKKAFDDLGVSILDVVDAENLLINNKDDFIQAQIEKAKASVYIEQQKEAITELIKKEKELEDYQNNHDKIVSLAKIRRPTKDAEAEFNEELEDKKRELREMKAAIETGYKDAADAEERGLKILKDASIQATQDGQEASDAFTEYVLKGTTKAEQNLNTFGGRVQSYFNGLLSDLRNSSNSFANFFGNILGNLFGSNNDPDSGDGTIGDRLDRVKKKYEDAVQHLADLRKRDSKATAADIEDAKKNVDKYAKLYETLSGVSITQTGGRGKGGGSSQKTESEKFAEELSQKKALYQKYLNWVTSSDATVREAAATEFSSLLENGKTYLAFLEQQRDSIGQKATKTATDLQKLQMLNNEIAEATKGAVLKDFQSQLEADLQACTTLGAMLDIIEQRRQAIAGDDTELGNQKRDILTDAEDDAKKQIQSETAQLLSDYSDYLDGRLKKAQKYVQQISALKARLQTADTQAERDQINAAIDFYGKLYDLHIESAEELEEINAESYARFATYEQKRLEITKQYDTLIGAARLKGDEDLAKKLEGARDIEILKETKAYKELFDDLSDISVKTVENTRKTLIAIIKSIYEQGKITADDYKNLIDDINKKANSVYQNASSGWQSLMGNSKSGGIMNFMFGEGDLNSKISDFKNIFTGAKEDVAQIGEGMEGIGEGMEGAGQGAAEAIRMVDTIIKAVYQTLKAVSDTLDVIADYQDSIGKSDSADTLRDWSDCINAVNETAMSGWENLKNGNVAGAISDTISLPFKLITTLNKIHDKHIDKTITKHSEAVRDLTNAYKQLQWQVNKSLGEETYKDQSNMISNLRKQKQEIKEMQRLEESKKNSDSDKVADYVEQQADLQRQIQDIFDEISETITQTTAKDLAGDLADALVAAFEGGEDAAKAFGEVADDVIKKAVVNALKLQLLEAPLQNAIKQLQRDMGFDEEGNGTFDGLSESEQKRFKAAVEAAGANFQAAMEMYKDLFEQLDDSDPTTLSGAIKGASQESIDLLAGQTNAVRQNQVTQLALFRQQLIHVSNIDANVGVIAGRLLSILNVLTSPAGTSLRSQGITD